MKNKSVPYLTYEETQSLCDNKTIPFITYEATQARHERTTKRLIIALIIVTALMLASNIAWLYAWMQYDYESTETQEISVDSRSGPANYIGNDGDIYNGQNSSEDNQNKK